VQLIESAHDPLGIAAGLCRVAEAAIDVLARATITQFEAIHGRVPGGELVILGLGRLGGGMLTHASDLDIIYLFTGSFSGDSDGTRPLGATLYFNRLAQRISAALSVPTAEGALYEVDTRLRPQGTQGPLAASIDSFALYQREQAWTWEHMALARARVLFGSAAARAALDAIIAAVLSAPRDAGKLAMDVREMRAKMAAHKPAKGALDVKLLRGGLVDVEFIVHFLQLRDGAIVPKSLVPDLSCAISALAAAGALPAELGEAHDFLSRMLIASRLLLPDGAIPGEGARALLAKACGLGNWEALLARLAAARGVVAGAWRAAFGEELET